MQGVNQPQGPMKATVRATPANLTVSLQSLLAPLLVGVIKSSLGTHQNTVMPALELTSDC